MDPQQAACFSTAQTELHDLFRNISSNGRVTATELQQTLEFAAGDVKQDLQELMLDMKTKHTQLDEQEFVRVLWKKMYLPHLVYSTKNTKSSADSKSQQQPTFNIPLAHVIISIKRRKHMKEFAEYYASRGISGADHLTTVTYNSKNSLEHQSTKLKRSSSTAVVIPPPSITSLRQRASACYDVIVYTFDPNERTMQSQCLIMTGHPVQIFSCSRLYCLLFARENGNFVLGSSYFARNLHKEYQQALQQQSMTTEPRTSLPLVLSRSDDMLVRVKLEELGLRNVVTAAAGPNVFIAATERKLHQWKAPEPINGYPGAPFMYQQQPHTDIVNELDNEGLDLHAEGDCFGLVGGKKLLERTKTITDIPNIRQLAAGEHFTTYLTSTGEVCAWENDDVRSTLAESSTNNENKPFPLKITSLHGQKKVVRIACGLNHALLLTANPAGQVFAWGSNIYGQLGHGNDSSMCSVPVNEPMPITIPGNNENGKDVVDVACGDDHSMVLTSAGLLFTFGNNWHGQLGHDSHTMETGCFYEPKGVAFPASEDQEQPSRVYLICANGWTSACVMENGKVYQWGQCIPSGKDSVCGLVSRWIPQPLDISDWIVADDDRKSPNKMGHTFSPVWQGISIAKGLVVLCKHRHHQEE